MSAQHIYDIVGIGVGPFNLGLACLTQPLNELSTIFFDGKMSLTGIRVLCLKAVPCKFHSLLIWSVLLIQKSLYILNYLKLHNKLYQFFIRESFLFCVPNTTYIVNGWLNNWTMCTLKALLSGLITTRRVSFIPYV